MIRSVLTIFICSFTFISCAQKPDKATEEGHRFEVVKSDTEWKAELDPKAYEVLRGKGTERAFSGKYDQFKDKGTFICAACDNPLFDSKTKFDSGTGWPSFYTVISDTNVVEEVDRSHGWVRREVLCGRCGGHLGHVFEDGPAPTGLRYCVNSVSLDFVPE